MDTSQHGGQGGGATRQMRRVTEWSDGGRIMVSVFTMLLLALGTAHLVHSGLDMPVAEREPAGQAVPGKAEYFPAQFVNQATTVEPHIDAY